MNLTQYIAQNAQQEPAPQEAQQTQEALPVDLIAAKMDAEKYLSLKAQAAAAIDAGTAPAQLLVLITGALFGESSPQAAAVAGRLDAEKHPGGHEMAIAGLRQRKRLLKQQQKQHEEQIKGIAAEIDEINRAEREIFTAQAEAAALDNGLIEVAAFCKALPGTEAKPEIIAAAGALFTRHKGNPAAMGLLYGSLTEIGRTIYAAGGFDLVQAQQLADLRAQILAAIQ